MQMVKVEPLQDNGAPASPRAKGGCWPRPWIIITIAVLLVIAVAVAVPLGVILGGRHKNETPASSTRNFVATNLTLTVTPNGCLAGSNDTLAYATSLIAAATISWNAASLVSQFPSEICG